MSEGIRSCNVPLGALIDVLGHADAGGGTLTLRRMAVADLVVQLAGIASGDPNTVAGLASQIHRLVDALAGEAQARAALGADITQALDREAQTRREAIQAEIEGRQAGEADLRKEIGAAALVAILASLCGDRPGLAPAAFAATALGHVGDSAPLGSAGTTTGPLGPAYRLDGGGTVAPRAAVSVDPDTIHVVRARYWRLAEVGDPNNGAVDVGIQWLDADGGDAGNTLLARDRNLRVQDGPRALNVRVPSLTGDRIQILPPAAAVAWRPFLRTYDANGATAIGRLGAFDATYAGVYAPDVDALAVRLGAIEGRITAGLPLATPILPSFAVAELPKPGTPGRKAWARDGRAPGAGGQLEPANAGSGVEVADNGARWVITGTNREVQA